MQAGRCRPTPPSDGLGRNRPDATFLMLLADFGQSVLNLPRTGHRFSDSDLAPENYRPRLLTEAVLNAAEFLVELLDYSPDWTTCCRCPGMNGQDATPTDVRPWPIATPRSCRCFSTIPPRLHMAAPDSRRIPR